MRPSKCCLYAAVRHWWWEDRFGGLGLTPAAPSHQQLLPHSLAPRVCYFSSPGPWVWIIRGSGCRPYLMQACTSKETGLFLAGSSVLVQGSHGSTRQEGGVIESVRERIQSTTVCHSDRTGSSACLHADCSVFGAVFHMQDSCSETPFWRRTLLWPGMRGHF